MRGLSRQASRGVIEVGKDAPHPASGHLLPARSRGEGKEGYGDLPKRVLALVPRVQAFKFLHFGHDIIVLHEHEIRKQKPPFVFLQNRPKNGWGLKTFP